MSEETKPEAVKRYGHLRISTKPDRGPILGPQDLVIEFNDVQLKGVASISFKAEGGCSSDAIQVTMSYYPELLNVDLEALEFMATPLVSEPLANTPNIEPAQ